MATATFKKAIKGNGYKDDWKHTDLLYEYRGYEYIVTKHNNGYAFDSLRSQHEAAQKDIDERIANANKPIPEWKYEGSADEAFDISYRELEMGL